MHHAGALDGLDRHEQVFGDLHGDVERQGALRQHVLERAAGDALHDDVRRAVGQLAHVVHARDVRVFEAGTDVRLAQQPRPRAFHVLVGDVHDLERDRRADPRV